MGWFSGKSKGSTSKNTRKDRGGNSYTKDNRTGNWRKDRPTDTAKAWDEASKKGNDTGI